MRKTFGTPIPGMPKEPLRGKLIVLEGADGSGRTTEVELLREWLEIQGRPVRRYGASSIDAGHEADR